MAQMNVSIPEKLKKWAETRVAEGGYSSTSDYVRDLVRRDQEHSEKAAWLHSELEKGLNSPPSGRSLAEIIAAHRKTLG